MQRKGGRGVESNRLISCLGVIMAKRELSSTLKNLKFMQRATQKEDFKKEEAVSPAEDLPSSGAFNTVKRCVVIVEGDPQPGASGGRMSFLSFNPSIDKLNDKAPDAAATSSGRKNETTPIRVNGTASENGEFEGSSRGEYGDLKRKHVEVCPSKNEEGGQDSTPKSCHSCQKQHKREKLDWSVLRPPKYQNKER